VDEDPRTYAIIGAAMQVHNELGPGFLEITYQHALQLEFEVLGIPNQREVPIGIWYRNVQLGGTYRADFLCYEDILVELKALPVVGKSEVRQLGHYLTATGTATGLLLNFGADRLQFQRVRPRKSVLSGPPEQVLLEPVPSPWASLPSAVPHT
jgi:GxxExxY protein